MSILEQEADAAYEAELAAKQAALDAHIKTLRAAATEAVRAVLARADGSRITLTDAGMTVRDVALDAQVPRVVWSNGTTSLAAVFRDDAWRVFLVEQQDGQWTRVGDRLTSLADLGRARSEADDTAAGPAVTGA